MMPGYLALCLAAGILWADGARRGLDSLGIICAGLAFGLLSATAFVSGAARSVAWKRSPAREALGQSTLQPPVAEAGPGVALGIVLAGLLVAIALLAVRRPRALSQIANAAT